MEGINRSPAVTNLWEAMVYAGKLRGDAMWVTTMMDAEVPVEDILRIWDRKDENEREQRARLDERSRAITIYEPDRPPLTPQEAKKAQKAEDITGHIQKMEARLEDRNVDPKRRARIQFNLIMNKDVLEPKPLDQLVAEVKALPALSKQANGWLSIWEPKSVFYVKRHNEYPSYVIPSYRSIKKEA